MTYGSPDRHRVAGAAWIFAAALGCGFWNPSGLLAQDGAPTLEGVIESHIAARGGREAWAEVRSLRMSGEFSAYSVPHPFELYKERPGRYFIDHTWGDKRVVMGLDGETAWRINPWYRIDWAVTVTGPEVMVLHQDAHMTTPLFDYRNRGCEAELGAETEVDGLPALPVTLTCSDAAAQQGVEVWYLDPETFLEVARDSTGADYDRPVEQRTYYDDFRTVADLTLPFLVESLFDTRHRVMEVREVSFNAAPPPGVFDFPVPEGMGRLQGLAGTWTVQEESRLTPRQPPVTVERQGEIVARLHGGLLEEHFESGDLAVSRSLSYDRFRGVYVLTQMNNFSHHLDVQRGTFEDGRLLLTNEDSGTTWDAFGTTLLDRHTISEISAQRFVWEQERSFNGGRSWFVSRRSVYTRP